MIKIDMKMPKTCGDCVFCVEYNMYEESDQMPDDPHFRYECCITNRAVFYSDDGYVTMKNRDKKCPLMMCE